MKPRWKSKQAGRTRLSGPSCVCRLVSSLVAVVLATTQPAGAYPRPGTSERVSVNSSGLEGDSTSQNTAMSADGRYIAFDSLAGNLVAGDTNGKNDIYVRDLLAGTTERVSVSSNGGDTNGPSYYPALNSDGRYAVFDSQASNLVAGDTSPTYDVFVRDRVAGTIERVSVGEGGVEGNGNSRMPGPGGPQSRVISSDGRYVVFQSQATNLVAGDTSTFHDVFVRDRTAGTTRRVSIGPAGEPANGIGSLFPSISANGRHVVFHSFASNLVADDDNGAVDIFVRDLQEEATERVSVPSNGGESNGSSYYPVASADGRYIVFHSDATNLVPGDTNAIRDVFLHDRDTGMTERVSVSTFGEEANAQSIAPIISPNGRFVTFDSDASNLIPSDVAGFRDSFIRDRETQTTERISLTSEGGETNRSVGGGALSADGSYVGFYGGVSNVVPGNTNADKWDVFLRHRGPGLGIGGVDLAKSPGQISVSGWATFSGAEMVAAVDSPDDGLPFGPSSAHEAGAEITGTSLIYRVEPEDLLLRMYLASLPAGGGTGISYVVEFTAGGLTYEIRALRSGIPPASPTEPSFALFRCSDTCTEIQQLSGGFGGSTGTEVVVSLPLGSVGLSEGAVLTSLRARTEGGAIAEEGLLLDELSAPNTTILVSKVEVGIAAAFVPEQEVIYSTPAALSQGQFSADVDTASLSAGDYRVWARSCLGNACGPAAFVDEGIAAPVPNTVVSRKTHGEAGTFDLVLTRTGNPVVECRTGGPGNDYQLVLTFPSAVVFSGAALSSGTGTVSSISGMDTPVVTVNLTGVTNAQTIELRLSEVDDGTDFGSVTIRMGVLLGDTTGNGSVNSSDISQTKSQSGQTVTASNFRQDVTVNGSINSSDISLVKSKSGTALP